MNIQLKHRIKHTFIMMVVLLLIAPVIAIGADIDLSAKIDALLSDPALDNNTTGIMVKSLADGRVLYEKNTSQLLIPASNLKLLTSAAALGLLGPDYTVKTALYAENDITEDGVINGDIYIKGGGDPVFTYSDLNKMAEALYLKGVRAISGRIVCDDSMFDNIRYGRGWLKDYESYSYAAQVSALNLNSNCIDVWVHPNTKENRKAIINLKPATSYFTIINNCATSKKGTAKKISIMRIHRQNTIIITGQIPIGYIPSSAEESITVNYPGLFTGTILKELLNKAGISAAGKVQRGIAPNNAVEIISHESPSISDLIRAMNKPSSNLIAECLLKMTGAKLKNEGSSKVGIEAFKDFFAAAMMDIKGINQVDGSGLSKLNGVTIANIIALLEFMHSHKDSAAYINSLPIAGIDGTMKSRLKGTSAEGITKAKTGTLSGVSSLSGYTQNADGEDIVFSIIMNNKCSNDKAKSIQDSIVTAITESTK